MARPIRNRTLIGLLVLALGCSAIPVLIPYAFDDPESLPDFSQIEVAIDLHKNIVGPAVGANKATPIDRISVASGFQVELIYSVPGESQGSWINLCTDDKGRILASDQFGGLYRFVPPEAGESLDQSAVEEVPARIRAVNGMVWAFGALYVAVNDYERQIPNGLYRITDSDHDDQLDHVALLRGMNSEGDHGVHAVVLAPDAESLFLITGNNTELTEIADSSPVPQIWGEDHLLPNLPDGRGHNRNVLAPGGVIYRISADGKHFEAWASGFRNVFDAAVNRDGELLTYDADMEFDLNLPWYRPARICHAVSGAEFGWRNGAGKRMPFYADNLPPVLDIGPGSPTGMTFGYGAKFPAKYQNALFALDWSWGKIYAVHLEPDGATYSATREEFLSGIPLPITDAIIHPDDGAMYFTIGGRCVQSGVYRVTYVGDEVTESVAAVTNPGDAVLNRRLLESFHGRQDASAVDTAWTFLDAEDRFVRFAARTALEHQSTDSWTDRALSESAPVKQVTALLALARASGNCQLHRATGSQEIDIVRRDQLLSAVTSIDFSELDHITQLALQRTIQIILSRFGRPDSEMVQRLIDKVTPLLAGKSAESDWFACETLAWLEAPGVARKAIELMQKAPSQEEQIHLARSIRLLTEGWTLPLRQEYFRWFHDAASYKGGDSLHSYIEAIHEDAVSCLSESDKRALTKVLRIGGAGESTLSAQEELLQGRSETRWSLKRLSESAETGLRRRRSFKNGRLMFAVTGCYACHRFRNQGGATGPDLTLVSRRYSPHGLLDQILHPSRVINQQFAAVTVLLDSGVSHTGLITDLNRDTIKIRTDLANPSVNVTIDRKQIEEVFRSKTSLMPGGLLNRLTENEIMDLLAYLLSGGDREHQFFTIN